MAENLGKASLELTADLGPLERNLKIADTRVDESKKHLEKLEKQAEAAERALKDIKMLARQGYETAAASEKMQAEVDELKTKAAKARLEMHGIKLEQGQALETEVAGHRIERTLDKISRKAGEARRALLGARLAGAGAGGGGGGLNGPLSVVGPGFGRGVGPFGSGYGRLGLVGTSILAGGILGPAAGPGALGLLAAIPTMAAAGAGALGTLALAFAGVGKAISGDKKAFEALQPAQQEFVIRIRSMKGWLDSLRETAGKAVFPGLSKGIEEALSPGTLKAITTAVNEYGTAIGGIAEKVGRGVGSSKFQNIFGPLMSEGAHELGTMADAAMSLADAVGVLGRAGIPLSRWITDSIASGARLVDSFTRAQDASGGLSHAMGEAKESLTLVARLGLALARVAGALAEALYPVSKIAVADLTDGLDGLADIINRNDDLIREIVGGALTALQSTIEAAVPIVGGFVSVLDAVADAIGGWDKAFEIVIGGYLALKLLSVADAVTKIGVASGEAGAAGAVGTLQGRLTALSRIGPIAIVLTLAISNRKEIDAWFESHGLGFMNKNVFELPSDVGRALGIGGKGKKPLTRQEIGNLFADITYGRLGTTGLADYKGRLSQADYDALMHHALSVKGDSKYPITPMTAAGDTSSRPPIPEVIEGQYIDPNPDSIYGADPPWTKNLGPKGPKPLTAAEKLRKRMDAFAPWLQYAIGDRQLGVDGGRLTIADVNKAVTENQLRGQARLNAAATRRATEILGIGDPGPASFRRQERSLLTRVLVRGGADRKKLAGLGLDELLERATPLLKKASVKSLRQVNEVLELASKRTLDPSVLANVQKRLSQFNETITKSFDKLSLSARQIARRQERAFLETFQAIVSNYAPNAAITDGATATHLYDIKHETREQTKQMRKIANRVGGSASDYAHGMGMFG